jgi:putative oxidoreductase
MHVVLGRYSAQTFALFRIVSGLLFALHGSQKLLGWPPQEGGGGGGGSLPPMMIAAGIIELVCGLMIAVGLLTGLAAFIASGEMAVAYFMAHFKATALGWIPLVNHGELSVIYCFAFLYIASRGAGIWSIDHAMRGSRTVSE